MPSAARRPGGLGVLRGVVEGVAEEARTRGFPSSSFGGFIYIVATTKYRRKLPDCPIVNRIGTYTGNGNVHKWTPPVEQAVPRAKDSPSPVQR